MFQRVVPREAGKDPSFGTSFIPGLTQRRPVRKSVCLHTYDVYRIERPWFEALTWVRIPGISVLSKSPQASSSPTSADRLCGSDHVSPPESQESVVLTQH